MNNDTCKILNQHKTKWKDIIIVTACVLFMIAGWVFYGVSKITVASLSSRDKRHTDEIIKLQRIIDNELVPYSQLGWEFQLVWDHGYKMGLTDCGNKFNGLNNLEGVTRYE